MSSPDPAGSSPVVEQLLRARDAADRTIRRLERHARRFRALVDRSTDVALILDENGVITYASPAARREFGHEPAALVGRNGLDFVHPDDRARAGSILAEVAARPGPHEPFTLRVRTADGGYLWAEEAVTNSLDDPAIAGIILNLRDVTARHQAVEALAESEQRYRAIVETAEEGILVLDADRRVTFANPRFAAMLGRTTDEMLGRSPADFVHPDCLELADAQLRARAGGTGGRYEMQLVDADGQAVWVLVSARPMFDQAGRFTGSHAMLTDITDRKLAEEQLRHDAVHDRLTGLANRSLLVDRAGQLLVRAERHDTVAAALFVDVDHFKLVNDSLGHGAGDELLVEIAQRLASAVRTDDTVARFGGDEFVVLCEELYDAKEAVDIGRRVLAAVAEPVHVAGQQLVVTASIGIAFTPAAGPDELLRDADTAMYVAKQRGRGRVEVFDPRAHDTAREELTLVNELRAALRRDELVVHYQPIVSVETQETVGAEALVRWQHPRRGLLTPDAFVPLAERVGMVAAIDRWVLREACRQAAAWLRAGAVRDGFGVAVNVSAGHLAEGDVVAEVEAALSATRLPPSALSIEVTETALIDDTERVVAALAALRDRGVTVSLDDFGTGYSSLTYLKRMPARRMKIDRSFVGGLGEGGDDDAIVASVVSLAESIGVECVAEGVETAEQLAQLRRLGCRLAQGYLWSPAVPADLLPHAVPGLAVPGPAGARARRRAGWSGAVEPATRARIMTMHRDGASLQTIAAALNAHGRRTPKGTRWHPATVARVIADLADRPSRPASLG